MPTGRYSVWGRTGDVVGTEDFRCAPGPMGWRYVSEILREEPSPHREIVDVAVDATWHVVRARIETGTHAIVQDPASSECATMPSAGLAATPVDYVLPLSAIGPRVVALLKGTGA